MKPMPEDWDRAVAVVAHPDDLEYGVASAVARWTGQGKQVSYLLVTRGEAGIAGMPPDKVAPLRVEEERRSAAVVGVTEVEFLDHPDGLVEYGIALRRDLAAAIRRLQPQVVIGMSFDLTWGEDGPVNHADHRAVGLATLDACRDAANEWVFPDAGPRATDIRDAYVAGTGDAASPRADLEAILMTGIPAGIIKGFTNFTGPVVADMLRLNTSIPPAKHPNIFGLLGGDPAGFPNGRRIADDVVAQLAR